MKPLFLKAIAIAAVVGIAMLLHNLFQYRNSAVALATITHVGQRICTYDGGDGSHIGCNRIAVKMSFKDGEIDREVDVEYGTNSRHAKYHGLLPPAAVGTQVRVVYVPGRPWLTRLAVNHMQGWGIAWLILCLSLFAWMAWRGDDHPLTAWLNSRRNKKLDEREWREIQPLDVSKK